MRLVYSTLVCFLLAYSTLLPATTVNNDNHSGLYLNWLDQQANAGENFYQFANGGWLQTHPLPSDYARWGTFQVLQEKNQQLVRNIIETAAYDIHRNPGSNEQKIGDFYVSGMDEASINKAGIQPLQPEFDRINNITHVTDLQPIITHLQMIGVDSGFQFGQMQDYLNSEKVIGVASQGGLGLPDRDYYLKNEAKFSKIRAAYVQHITNIFKLLGEDNTKAHAEAETVMKMETALANASMSRIDQRDPHAIYHIMNIAQLKSVTPHFSWQQYFKDLHHPEIKNINLAMPEFFKEMDSQLITISLEDWKVYLRWHLIHAFAPFLSQPFVDEDFNMATQLTGVQKLLPRWKRVLNMEDHALGFAIGKFYVEKNFTSTDKEAAKKLLYYIRQAMKNDLQVLAWMTPKTRQAALKKLTMMNERIGYPDVWRDYSKLTIDKKSYVLNIIRANEFLNERELNKIGKPVDKNEWEMTPQTVNAYYDASRNELNIPAGILQSPFFASQASAAVNYGAIGLVMGHEMTHGFDDQGAQFDGKGNLRNWWTAEDLKKFNLATQCIADQFSEFTVAGDLHVQGKLVVGEAAADLGGSILAYRAYHLSGTDKETPVINKFTPEQQFFIGAAHMYATNVSPDEARRLVIIDPHPPAIYRVNGTFANVPEFAQAFGITSPSLMIHQPRCVIW